MEFTLRFNRNDELKDQITFIPRVQKAVADPLHMSRLSDLFFCELPGKINGNGIVTLWKKQRAT